MKTLSAYHRLLIAASLLSLGGPTGTAADPPPVIAADPRIGQVLGRPSSRCDHVIDLLLLNQYRQDTGTGSSLPGEWPVLCGDLELQCVELVSEGVPGQGPLFRLTLQNHSRIPVGDFRITLVAVRGTIHYCSPSVTARVNCMEAGAVCHVLMQLPVSATAMVVENQQPCQFETLVAAIDSFDELCECDELNNVKILARTEISMFVPELNGVTGGPPTAGVAAGPNTPGGAPSLSGPAATPGDRTAPDSSLPNDASPDGRAPDSSGPALPDPDLLLPENADGTTADGTAFRIR